MSVIQSLDVLLKGNTSNLDSALDRSAGKVSGFSSQVSGLGGGLDRIGGAAGGGIAGLVGLATGFIGVAAAAKLASEAISFVAGRFTAIEDTKHLADELGLTYNGLVGIQHAASQAGVDAGSLDGALRHLTRTVSEAAQGSRTASAALSGLQVGPIDTAPLDAIGDKATASATAAGSALGKIAVPSLGVRPINTAPLDKVALKAKDIRLPELHVKQVDTGPVEKATAKIAEGGGEAGKALRQLGLSASDLNSLSPDKQMGKIADALANVANHGDQARLATELFGREGGSKLLPLLQNGSAGLARMAEEAKRLGLTLSDDQVASIEKANQAWRKMQDALVGIGNKIAVAVAPWVEKAADLFTYLFASVQTGISAAMPYLSAIWDTTKAYYTMLAEIATPIVNGIMDVMAEWGRQLGGQGVTFANLKTAFLSALFGMQYAFQHWWDFLSVGLDGVELGFVTFGNNVAHLFTVQIPTVFTAFASAAQTFFTNLGKNVSENAAAIWEAIKGGHSPELVWHDLTEGFGDAMKKINDSAARPATQLEQTLTKRIGDKAKSLGQGLFDYVKGKLKDFGVDAKDTAADTAKKTGADSTTTNKGTAAIEAGSLEAFKIIAGNGTDKLVALNQQSLKAVQDQRDLLKKLLDQGAKTGPKLGIAKV